MFFAAEGSCGVSGAPFGPSVLPEDLGRTGTWSALLSPPPLLFLLRSSWFISKVHCILSLLSEHNLSPSFSEMWPPLENYLFLVVFSSGRYSLAFIITQPEGEVVSFLLLLAIFRPLSLFLPSTNKFAIAHVNELSSSSVSCWHTHISSLTITFNLSPPHSNGPLKLPRNLTRFPNTLLLPHDKCFVLTSNNSSLFLALSWWLSLFYWEYRGNRKRTPLCSQPKATTLPATKSVYSAFPPYRRDVFPVPTQGQFLHIISCAEGSSSPTQTLL